VVLAAFFYGYITTQIIGGTLAQKVGGKLLLLFGICWTAILTLLTPVLTTAGGFGAIVAVRILEGIGEVTEHVITTCTLIVQLIVDILSTLLVAQFTLLLNIDCSWYEVKVHPHRM